MKKMKTVAVVTFNRYSFREYSEKNKIEGVSYIQVSDRLDLSDIELQGLVVLHDRGDSMDVKDGLRDLQRIAKTRIVR